MGILDNVLGNLLGGGNAAGGASPLQGVLMNLLSGQQTAQNTGNQEMPGQGVQNQGLAGLLGGQGGGGGLTALLGAFQQAGLGNIVQSWVGTGANQPVSPQQLQTVLGDTQVQSMANQAGMQPNDLLAQLSQHLPRAVDGVTPNGHLPDEGTVSV